MAQKSKAEMAVRKERFAQKMVEYRGDMQKAGEEVLDRSKYANDNSYQSSIKRLAVDPEVNQRIMEIMHLTFSPEKLRADLEAIRTAQKPIVYNGEVTAEYPDYPVRLELLKLYLRSAKVLGSDTPQQQTNVQFNVAVVDPQQALAIAKEINALSENITPETTGRRN